MAANLATTPKSALKNVLATSACGRDGRRVALKVQNCRVHFIDEQGRIVTPHKDGVEQNSTFTTSLSVDIPVSSSSKSSSRAPLVQTTNHQHACIASNIVQSEEVDKNKEALLIDLSSPNDGASVNCNINNQNGESAGHENNSADRNSYTDDNDTCESGDNGRGSLPDKQEQTDKKTLFRTFRSMFGHDSYGTVLQNHRRNTLAKSDYDNGELNSSIVPGGSELAQLLETFSEALRRIASGHDVLSRGVTRKNARLRRDLQRQQSDQLKVKQHFEASISQLKVHIDQFCTQSLRKLKTDVTTLQSDTTQRIHQLEENSGCLADEYNALADSVEQTFLQVDRDVVRLTELIHEDSTVVTGVQQKLDVLRKMILRLLNDTQSTHSALNTHQTVIAQQSTAIGTLRKENAALTQCIKQISDDFRRHRTEHSDLKNVVQKLSSCVAQLASPQWAPDWLAALGSTNDETLKEDTDCAQVPHVIVEPGQVQRVGLPLSPEDIEKLLRRKRQHSAAGATIKARNNSRDVHHTHQQRRQESQKTNNRHHSQSKTRYEKSKQTSTNTRSQLASVRNASNSSGIDEGGDAGSD